MFKSRTPRTKFFYIHELFWPSMGWARATRYIWLRVQRLQGTPYSIAAGLASGAAVSFTPFIGFHVLLAMATAFVFRGSLIASVIGTVVGNPWTFPLIWVGTYNLGMRVLDVPNHNGLLPENLSLIYIFDHPQDTLLPMAVGGIVAGIVAWLVVFFVGRDLVAFYQKKRAKRFLNK